MPFHRPCTPVHYSLSVPDPYRMIHRLTANQVDTTVTFSIPPGPWSVFMFAALDAHGPLTEPFAVSWSSTPLVPQQWYTIPPTLSTELTELQISRGSQCPYRIILLLARSISHDVSDSKPLLH